MGIIYLLFNNLQSYPTVLKEKAQLNFNNEELNETIWKLINPNKKDIYIEFLPSYLIQLKYLGDMYINIKNNEDSESTNNNKENEIINKIKETIKYQLNNIKTLHWFKVTIVILAVICFYYYFNYLNQQGKIPNEMYNNNNSNESMELNQQKKMKIKSVFQFSYSDIKLLYVSENMERILIYTYQSEVMLWDYLNNELLINIQVKDIIHILLNEQQEIILIDNNNTLYIQKKEKEYRKFQLKFQFMSYKVKKVQCFEDLLVILNEAMEFIIFDLSNEDIIWKLSLHYQITMFQLVNNNIYLACMDGSILTIELEDKEFKVIKLNYDNIENNKLINTEAIKLMKIKEINKNELIITIINKFNQMFTYYYDKKKSNLKVIQLINFNLEDKIVQLNISIKNQLILIYKSTVVKAELWIINRNNKNNNNLIYNDDIEKENEYSNNNSKNNLQKININNNGCKFTYFNQQKELIYCNFNEENNQWELIQLDMKLNHNIIYTLNNNSKDDIESNINLISKLIIYIYNIYIMIILIDTKYKTYPPLMYNDILLPLITTPITTFIVIGNYIYLIEKK
ncbi:hypothetical protein K502DRAFT_231492 [Neoconidiobolus thromboides FSU 785]|nr:hypothetical protein K502DRAFT_231492 [Neoconidiobolus thromboides FSU 785]